MREGWEAGLRAARGHCNYLSNDGAGLLLLSPPGNVYSGRLMRVPFTPGSKHRLALATFTRGDSKGNSLAIGRVDATRYGTPLHYAIVAADDGPKGASYAAKGRLCGAHQRDLALRLESPC